MFIKNAWYVAAWDHEITRALKPTTILGEDIVLFRTTAGKIAALENACPHRKLPLSMGRLKGDEVECGYHGLTFDCAGTCVRVPGATKIPKTAKVRSYPVEERYGLAWIWMGDATLANPAEIMAVEHWGDPGWGVNRGESMTVACNYLYITDNLLDPSHVAWVHTTSFGGAGCEDTPLETISVPSGVAVSRWMNDTPPAPFYAPFLKFQGNCDRQQYYEVRYPAHAIIKAVFVPAGAGGDGKSQRPEAHPDVFLMDSYNFMTPVDENNTRYYWFQLRNFAPNDMRVSDQFAESVRNAFAEDRVILEAVHKGMTEMRTPNMSLAIDKGPLAFRRGTAARIAAEQPAAMVAE